MSDRCVVAIHCKGGKGRTGTAVCAHLVRHERLSPDGDFAVLQHFGRAAQNSSNGCYCGTDAIHAEALATFENARTDAAGRRAGESQGVSGASQQRYVRYYGGEYVLSLCLVRSYRRPRPRTCGVVRAVEPSLLARRSI
eukprot:SAG11_NODE_1379_length_5083_cov_3.259831_3_plen_139_part_00